MTGPPHSRPRRRGVGRPPADDPVGEMETHRLILACARQLFIQRGFAAVSVKEVATAVGVSKPTLYYHFRGKQVLYTAMLCDLMCEIGSYIREIVTSDAPMRLRLLGLVHGYFLHSDATMEPLLRDAAGLIGRDLATEVHQVYQEHMLTPIEHLLTEGIKAGDIRAVDPGELVCALMGLLNAFTDPRGHLARTVEEHQAVAGRLVSLFLDGAAPRP